MRPSSSTAWRRASPERVFSAVRRSGTGAPRRATGREQRHRVRGSALGDARSRARCSSVARPSSLRNRAAARRTQGLGSSRSLWLASRASFVSGKLLVELQQVPEPHSGVRIRLRVARETLADPAARRGQLSRQPQAEAERAHELARRAKEVRTQETGGPPRGARRAGRTRSPSGESPGPAGPGGCWARPAPRRCRRTPCRR